MAYKKAIAEPEEELLTIKEAAELLKVSEVSVKRYVSKEIIPSVKIGGASRGTLPETLLATVQLSTDGL